jgi:hypothetical protein
MRKCTLLSLIYANLENTSAAVEEAAQTNAGPATLMHGCRYDQRGPPARLTQINSTKNKCRTPQFYWQNKVVKKNPNTTPQIYDP